MSSKHEQLQPTRRQYALSLDERFKERFGRYPGQPEPGEPWDCPDHVNPSRSDEDYFEAIASLYMATVYRRSMAPHVEHNEPVNSDTPRARLESVVSSMSGEARDAFSEPLAANSDAAMVYRWAATLANYHSVDAGRFASRVSEHHKEWSKQ